MSDKRRTVIAGNWKMNKTPAEAVALIKEIRAETDGKDTSGCDIVACVPYVDLAVVIEACKGSAIKVGAENVHWEKSGAYTGEISADMLKEIGTEYVIIGHSERRQYFGETDETVNKRVRAALDAGLKVILCVGELLTQREQGITGEIVSLQTKIALMGVSEQELDAARVKYLGKKGALTAILRGMGALEPNERREIGEAANIVRNELESAVADKSAQLKKAALEKRLIDEKTDVTLPGKSKPCGRLHPLQIIENRIRDIFVEMGFNVVEGPEVESVYNNFDALNAPADHPSRDFQDTFYINETTLLRTQTSPVQIRAMAGKTPPIRIISPGRTYRSDDVDATHSPMFHQVEGLVVDRGITMADLKGTLDIFARSLFGAETRTRLRPHNFPFTEPSAEVDVSCFMCGGKGCRLCKGDGWIEILGAGMVHPNVLAGCGIDPEIYSGFAFGMGLERVTMIRYNIDDMRLLYENDVRFLAQF